MFNSAFVIVLGPGGHGFGTINTGLYFLGLCVGITVGVVINAVFQEPSYRREVRRNEGRNMPEGRVRMWVVDGITFLISLFVG